MTNRSIECAFFLDSPFLSGAEHQVLNNIRALIMEGLNVRVYMTGNREFCRDVMGALPLQQIYFQVMPRHETSLKLSPIRAVLEESLVFWRTFFWSFRQLAFKEFTFVHVNNGGYPGSSAARAFALAAISLTRSPVVMTVNNMAISRTESKARYLDIFYDYVVSKSRIHWVLGSQAAANRLRDVIGVSKDKLHAIHNGVALRPCGFPKGHCPQQVTVESTLKTAKLGVAIGHLEPRKGHATLISAIEFLKAKGRLSKDWFFLIEGAGSQAGKLKSQIESANLGDQVRLIGRSPCIWHLMRATDVLIHPSLYGEDLPNVISEAMSLGKPVVASAVAGIPEQVLDGNTGVLFQPGDYEALALAIETLMGDGRARVSMGQSGAKRHEQLFSVEVSRRAYTDFYEGLSKKND